MTFNESWTFFHIQTFVLIIFILHFIFKDGYTPTHTHTHKCKYPSIPDPMGNDIAMAFSDSNDLIYQAGDEGEEDCEVPGELSRLLQQEKKGNTAPWRVDWDSKLRYWKG